MRFAASRIDRFLGAVVVTVAIGAASPASAGGPGGGGLLASHLFAEALPAPRLVLEGLPGDPATAPEPRGAEAAPPGFSTGLVEAAPLAPYVAPKRSFALAAGEVALLEVLPWSTSRFLTKSEFAFISIDTVRQNLETGFTYDRDSFHTDQFSHPFHGSLFFNAARENGYSFWESGAFSFFGSFVWETGMEAEPPAFNDLVNTTLGGMDRGEISYRLATLLRDNTARGGSRFWRELGAAVLSPVGAFNRLLKGDLNRKFENPSDRFPSRLVFEIEGAYRDGTSALSGDEGGGQGALELRLRYGDPFDGERHKPYEVFDVAVDLTTPGTTLISRVESRGIVLDGPLGGDAAAGPRQRLALFLHFNYYDNGPISFGAESFDLSHLLQVPLGRGAELRTEAGIAAAPLAALQVDYKKTSEVVFGRAFDYGPAASVQASARVRQREIDLVKVAYGLLWQSPLDGMSRHSRIHSFTAEARVPFFNGRLSAGAGWGWTRRTTTYDGLPTVDKSGSAIRLFAALTFR